MTDEASSRGSFLVRPFPRAQAKLLLLPQSFAPPTYSETCRGDAGKSDIHRPLVEGMSSTIELSVLQQPRVCDCDPLRHCTEMVTTLPGKKNPLLLLFGA